MADDADNCILVPNPARRDTGAGGFGNDCAPGFDNNLVVNATDRGILKSMFFQAPGPSGLVP